MYIYVHSGLLCISGFVFWAEIFFIFLFVSWVSDLTKDGNLGELVFEGD